MSKQVISFHYTLTDKRGKEIDSSIGAEPLAFLEGSSQIIPGLEVFLLGLKKGDKSKVTVSYKDAYGAYDQTLVSKVPRDSFPAKEIKTGDMFQARSGDQEQVVIVLEVTEQSVTIDGNHPLAGQDLTFDVEIMDRRDATSDEILHGHVHGPHGHHH